MSSQPVPRVSGVLALLRDIQVPRSAWEHVGVTPETRYALNGDVHLAYQVFGKGPPDLLVIESWVHHVELVWDVPEQAQFLGRLGAFARVVIFDRRGTGLSDPIPLDRLPDLETQVEDALAVLDAAESDRPALLGIGDGGLVAMLLAAMHPERCGSLVLQGSAAKYTHSADYRGGCLNSRLRTPSSP